MPECAKTHLQQSRISKFSGGEPPDPPLQGERGKGGEREGKDREGRGGTGREGGRGEMGWGGGARHGLCPPPQRQALDPPLV